MLQMQPMIKMNDGYRTKVEFEYELLHLMYQFRQIHNKYGLIVSNEIEQSYDNSCDKMNNYQHFISQLEKQSEE